MFTVNRKVEYKGLIYKVVEVLGSNNLLVVLEKDFNDGNFPLQTYIIPGK